MTGALIFVASIDTGSHNDLLLLQDHMLQNLFDVTSARDFVNFLHQSGFLIPCDVRGDDYCELMECTCDSHKFLTKIEIGELDAPNWNIDWFPGTMWLIDMKNVRLGGQNIVTKMLPRELQYLRMLMCDLVGDLDMESLPRKLQELFLGGNRISGTARLTHLPENIQIINMTHNMLHRVIVVNDLLPKRLKDAAFYSPGKKVKVLCLDASKVDIRVNTDPCPSSRITL